MAGPQQTILFTAMPRGITIDPARLPVSVLVSPRLSGSAKLGSFPDWLDWTGQVKSKGMKITFATGPKTYVADVDTGPLQPTLWNSIFDQSTLVDEYTFDDFKSAMDFAVRVGEIAEQEGHHPDLHVAWGKVVVETWTHKIKGLHRNDFILAAKVDAAHAR